MPLEDADKQWLKREIRDEILGHVDRLYRWLEHGGGDPPDPSPPHHPYSLKAILDRLDGLERQLPRDSS